jgi:signal peptidase I
VVAEQQVKSTIRDIVETLVLTAVIFLLVRSVVQNFKVEGRSMEPTLHNGQYLVINKAAYWRIDRDLLNYVTSAQAANDANKNRSDDMLVFGEPMRGDVIVFRFPRDPTRDFIKRVIALPGDTVEIRQGKVYVNGQFVDEAYINEVGNYSWPPRKMDAGEYFVLGDNRNNSSDSHVWGPVPRDNIIGKAWISYWPIDQLGFLAGANNPSTAPVAVPAR